jgi:hypothetical protein
LHNLAFDACCCFVPRKTHFRFASFNNMDHLFKNDDSSDDEDDRREPTDSSSPVEGGTGGEDIAVEKQ